ncbi:hypothetical protein J2R78_006916 [Bradyrhizobium sp. USDA 4538]|nr:hypothetical protein [Bradyrhizobium sp. USDA 4538]MCP1904515.1 hypothetical protein [Bradyrhizobium sp. USDA 4537]MCP1989829.1 hypothetical protein [Bradyrhizobium sp. USDA 4539]
MVAVAIEGPSPDEQPGSAPVEAGEELIDIAEYFGSEDIKQARLVRYMQLKHSTLHADDPWTASGLEKTIRGYAKRYAELQKTTPRAELANKLEFWFVTNRPISSDVAEAVEDAANEATARHPNERKKLEDFTGLTGADLADFCKLLHFEDREDGYWDQRNILFQDVSGYLPNADVDAPTQLKELVTRKALSESGQNPIITKIDVLRALKTDESLLYPAANLVAEVSNAVPREQEPTLIQQIVAANGPVVVHASGGVGKSVFATQIGQKLPPGSVCILYDCFGNGEYRSAAKYRHRHKDALVQIANELAAMSLCHLLIPTASADAAAYVRAFVYRLRQAATLVRLANPHALLCIVVDAADNAQMAAQEIGEIRSFAKDLIRVQIPQGVRLVFLCRSHRRDMLEPPHNAAVVELRPFSRAETDAFLRQNFPDAIARDVDEFHRLSSHNPRVQALALSRGLPLQETLRLLGPNPTTVEDAISSLLDDAIANLKDVSGPIERSRVEAICEGLAALRPLVPIPILSEMSGVEQDAIKSFAYDIGRPLRVVGETVQFLDEPAETWFREKFRPTAAKMGEFIARLKPLAGKSAYVASTLPQLMLEAGQFNELVELALSSSALPEGSPLEKRDVELQRLQFALKAGLRSRHYLAAAKLALKAGGETAGDERQRSLLQANTDLAAEFLETDLIQEIVSRRTFGSGWLGSHHAYEAALLSGREELIGEARSRLRMAHEWLRNWSRLSPKQREEEPIEDQDIAELTLAHLNIHGPTNGADSLRTWKPREVSYRVGRLVVRRLIDHGRFAEIEELARSAGNDVGLVLAVARELREVQKQPPAEATRRTLKLLLGRRIDIRKAEGWDDKQESVDAVLALVESALKGGEVTYDDADRLLSRYLPSEPPRGLASRFSTARFPLLRAYTLRAALREQPLELADVAHAELKEEINKANQHSKSRDLQEFEEDVGALLPWHKLWASVLIGRVKKEDVAQEIAKTAATSSRAERIYYRDGFHTSNEVALLWMDILHQTDTATPEALAAFDQWKNTLKRPLFTPTLNSICRLCALKDDTKSTALVYAAESYALTKNERSNADSKSDGYIDVARAILTTSKADAKAYFNEAVEVASKIGDENLARWEAILDLADHASRPDRPAPLAAYKFSRCAELTYAYVDRDKHFPWHSTVHALCGLCPTSALTVMSRWRDRGFGWHERILPIAVENLIERNVLDPRDALPLVGFRAEWDYDGLLGHILARCENSSETASAAQIIYRYARFAISESSSLKKLQDVAAKHGITLDGLAQAISFAEQEEKDRKQDHDTYDAVDVLKDQPSRDWNAIFASTDLTSPSGLSQAHDAFRQTEPPFYEEEFFSQAMQRIRPGAEAQFVEAFVQTPEFELYSLRHFLEQIPASWKDRPAITQALAQAFKLFCRRHCMDIRKSRYYQRLPLEKACTITGVSVDEIVDVVLSAIGETSDLIETDRLFSLLGLLTYKLSADEALEALTYGMDLFNSALDDADGDGPWRDDLLPPADIREALAGYIWGMLAAPQTVSRWEGAHAVLETCTFGRTHLLTCLMTLASRMRGTPFADGDFHFYRLHAVQWLLIGLARASIANPRILIPHAQQLLDLTTKPHVLIREFAARTLLALIETGQLSDEDGLADRLKSINESKMAIVESDADDDILASEPDEVEKDEDRYYFGIDIGPYWYAPLGRIFGVSQAEIERRALRVIRKDFVFSARGRWDEDERAKRNLYEEQHTSHSHGSSPRTDNLHFYHAYHAMMVVAGQLLATRPVHRNRSYDEGDKFQDWVCEHDLTRKDGRWLWDRRDPQPLERNGWLQRSRDDSDRRTITDGDFEEALRSGATLNVWGSWSKADSHREQSTNIYSALVGPDRSEALLRALASTRDSYDYAIPSADSEMEIDESGFELKGWIQLDSAGSRLDGQDRWAGGIPFPPPQPAPFIVQLMGIQTDADRRFWKDQHQVCSIESQVWGHFDEGKRHTSTNPDNGRRLQASLHFMTDMLKKLNRDLIIEVQIERHRRYRSYESSEKDDERVPKQAKLYLLSADGNFRTV